MRINLVHKTYRVLQQFSIYIVSEYSHSHYHCACHWLLYCSHLLAAFPSHTPCQSRTPANTIYTPNLPRVWYFPQPTIYSTTISVRSLQITLSIGSNSHINLPIYFIRQQRRWHYATLSQLDSQRKPFPDIPHYPNTRIAYIFSTV